MVSETPDRRRFLQQTSSLVCAGMVGEACCRLATAREPGAATAPLGSGFRLRYILGSPMYGKAPLADVLPQAKKIGATHIDIWPLPHANHLEQVAQLGNDRFVALLAEHGIGLGVVTRYDLKPTQIDQGLAPLKRLGGEMLISGAGRGKGETEKERVRSFLEQMRPHVEKAERLGVVLGIENHANTLLHSPDSIRYFAEMNNSRHLGLAMAPYHLPQDPQMIASLITDLGEKLVFFQGWQYGNGCLKKLPKEEEMLQMPGRGPLDFRPIVAALASIHYQGWTEIFMHPVPRGIPIRESTAAVTEEINRARAYLDSCLS